MQADLCLYCSQTPQTGSLASRLKLLLTHQFQADKEAAEAEELKEELGLKIDDSLKAMIQQRQQSRESHMGAFFDQLEAKYAQPKKSKTNSSDKETKSRKKSKK